MIGSLGPIDIACTLWPTSDEIGSLASIDVACKLGLIYDEIGSVASVAAASEFTTSVGSGTGADSVGGTGTSLMGCGIVGLGTRVMPCGTIVDGSGTNVMPCGTIVDSGTWLTGAGAFDGSGTRVMPCGTIVDSGTWLMGAGALDGLGTRLMGCGAMVGSGNSLNDCEISGGSSTGPLFHSRREMLSIEPLRTGVAPPRAERRPKAGRRLRVCMTILRDRVVF